MNVPVVPFQNGLSTKNDSVIDLLASVEKIKMNKTDKPLNFIFDQIIVPVNLKEKFLYATFEIVAEKGADALSASELIKRTHSSKGALFHHFDTIDHLCIESLNFFKRHLAKVGISGTLALKEGTTLEAFLMALMEDSLKKQGTRFYLHLINFFRDRSIRDDRYQIALKEFLEVRLNYITDNLMPLLSPHADRDKVHNKVVFMSMTIERAAFQRVIDKNSEACQEDLNHFLNFMMEEFKSL
jgi:AcrR family transcriptional regulator